jgi:hypothetical protein
VRGTVERVDAQQRELVVTNEKRRIVLHWNDSTRFNESLTPGDSVKVYYRTEPGRWIAREVKLARSNTCVCSRK